MDLPVITAEDVDALLPMPDAIRLNAQAYILLSQGQTRVPQRTVLESDAGVTLFMPAYVPSTRDLTLKVVSVFPGNVARGLPTLHALVLVLDAETGVPLALVDGTRLTALRTGAGVGAATEVLAREDSRVLALFGAGGQAPDQVAAILAVRPIEEVRIYTPSGRSAARLAEAMAARYPHVTFRRASTPREAVRGADIITCVTTSSTPVFDPADVAPGTHINGVGSFTPQMREVQVKGLSRLRVFVDSLAAAQAEAGDLIQAVEEGHLRWEEVTEIGRVLAGAAPGRRSAEEITFFKSVGVAVQDALTAGEIVRRRRGGSND
ncbi:MAG: ornithine cyclodeaminase family protein [Chloroflexi bacterium]|nr:ornithine cyclodeaminase family protein [Chloroflexota bacterium]